MTTGAIVLLCAVAIALAAGLWRMRTDGRFRDSESQPASPAAALVAAAGHELGERATLVQFSSAFCAPCRTTRVVLSDIAEREDGVTHVDVDAEQHLDAVRELGILRTPTTLVLDGTGAERMRAAGVPTRDRVVAVLRGLSHDVDTEPAS